MMNEVDIDGREQKQKRSINTGAKVLHKRQRSKTLSILSKEDYLQWLQNVKISELHRYGRIGKEFAR